MSRIRYLGRSLARVFSKAHFRCPNCHSAASEIVDRKFVITQLRRCQDCRLLFRTPTDDEAANQSFYESEYSQDFTTTLPDPDTLAALTVRNFKESDKDYGGYIETLRRAGLQPGAKIFDYGCSWGYGSYQLRQAGFEVVSFEIAPTRRDFAKSELACDVVEDMEQVVGDPAYRGQFDCFFSSHVIEHVPVPNRAFAYAQALLKADGLFLSFTPNGSAPCRGAHAEWSKLWGEVHPNFIDDEFLNHHFANSPRLFASSPVAEFALPQDPGQPLYGNDLAGTELFFIAVKQGAQW